MVNQYPHTIVIEVAEAPVKDSKGNYSVPEGLSYTRDCRAEPNGSNGVISGPDGKVLSYSWIVYLPVQTFQVPYGSQVRITLENGAIYTGFVKRHSNGQLNTRLWV